MKIALHPDAESEIRTRFGGETTPFRLQMGEFPVGSAIIPNPYNRIPGFSVGHHHFVPGFPVMAWPMVEWVLDTQYSQLFNAEPEGEASIIIYESAESTLTPLMVEIESRYRGLKVFSLPRVTPERYIELGVRGDAAQVALAIAMLKAGLSALGFPWTPFNA